MHAQALALNITANGPIACKNAFLAALTSQIEDSQPPNSYGGRPGVSARPTREIYITNMSLR